MNGKSELQFGQAWHPNHQHSLRVPKGEPTQDRWIVGAFRDADFDLLAIDAAGGQAEEEFFTAVGRPYSDLWACLAAGSLAGRKWWLIGWRVRYALERANFLRALERGDVRLPVQTRGKNVGKHTGRLTMSSRILEVDIECGANKIKLLDWQNYGVTHEGYSDDVRGVTGERAVNCLRDYLAATSTAGVRVIKSTAAQLGWSHARQGGLGCELACNLDQESRRLERLAYHGGRCEAFRLGEIPGTTYSLDVRSCYATICRDELLPCRLIEEYRAGCAVTQIETAGPDHWIAEVVLRTDEADYPLRWDGSPIFPVGQFRTALPWPELRHALMRGRVVKVLRAARYATGPVLRPYAEWYLQEREWIDATPSPMGTRWLKAAFNASLGYTAREKYQWEPWEVSIPWDYWIGIAKSPEDNDSAVQAQKLADETRWLKVAGEPREAVPFLHATICSYARVRLLSIFEAAGRQNVLYCDTDGILVNQAGALNLTVLGEWTSPYRFGLVERFPPDSARILGQKTYSVGDNVIAAGVVGSRQNRTLRKTVLTTETGRVDSDGRVHPFVFRCDDSGDQNERWINEEC